MKAPLLTRALVIAGVAAAILLPIRMIDGKIAERQALATHVVAQFAAETSGAQGIVGPLLALTCEETYIEEREIMRGGKAETIAQKKLRACPTAYFAPRSFKAVGTLPVESLHRGIYPIRLYRATLELAGEFAWPAEATPQGPNHRAWKQAYLVTYVKDPRGIKEVGSSISTSLLAASGDATLDAFSIREALGGFGARKEGSPLAFTYVMTVLGTSTLQIAPVGDRNEIRLSSDWPHPSFGFEWVPDQRHVSAEGFEATWKATSVATGGNATWARLATERKLASAAGAGVSLFDPVNVYALSYRATQYAFLFVLFTFTALALTEAVAGIRVHAMQYALVGSAIAAFFLLLIALSEHVAFGSAYAAAATACVALLTFYLRHPLASPARAAVFLAIFVAMYGLLYVLLLSEDHALLMGSLAVFAGLAAAMIATRKLDWTAFARRLASA